MDLGIIDNVKIRVRTHAPNNYWEREFDDIDSALIFLKELRTMIRG